LTFAPPTRFGQVLEAECERVEGLAFPVVEASTILHATRAHLVRRRQSADSRNGNEERHRPRGGARPAPGRLLSYEDDGTPGNVDVTNPVVVGFGGWLEFRFLFSNDAGIIYVVVK
jgi:hypothetical protein